MVFIGFLYHFFTGPWILISSNDFSFSFNSKLQINVDLTVAMKCEGQWQYIIG